MPEPVVEIPNRPAFRASEVCELAQIPPYVLKSWEKEFAGLGVAPKPGAARVYRRADVEQVLRIKQMLFNEGLTLSGVRRKLEGEPKVEQEPLPELPPAGGDVREKVGRVKQELRSLLEMLSGPAAGDRAVARTAPPPAASVTPSAVAPSTEDAAGSSGRSASPWPEAAGADVSVAGSADEGRGPSCGDLPLLAGIPESGADAPRTVRRAKRAPRAPGPSA